MTDPMDNAVEQDLAGAYVLNALDEGEREAFELLLDQSPDLAAQVADLREAVAMFAVIDEQAPPQGLKSRVMAQIELIEQDAPEPHPARDAISVEHDLTDEVDADRVISIDDARTRRQRSTVLSRVGLAVGAIAAGVAAVLGLSLAQLNDRVQDIQRTADQVAAVVSADDAQQRSVALADGGVLSAVVSADDGAAVVVSRDLGEIGEDEIYALWTIDGEVATAVGELTDGEAIAVSADFDLIGLTVEPAGPLDQPTGEILALLEA